jgi:hypothetical protein
MKAMRGISLYSYPYLHYKNPLSFLLLFVLSNKIKDKGRAVSAWKRRGRGGEVRGGRKRRSGGKGGRNDPNTVYTYESKMYFKKC